MSDTDEKWTGFVEACRKVRKASKERAIPTQMLAIRDGEEIAAAQCEVNSEGVAQYAIAIMTSLGCDEVFLAMDSYYAGSNMTSPYTGKKWEQGEMEFDYKENPNTAIKEALMTWCLVKDHAKLTRGVVDTYARNEDGSIEFLEEFDADADTSDGIQQMLHHFWHMSNNKFGALMDTIRAMATSEWKLATLDKAAMNQLNEMFEFGQFGLLVADDDSVRTKVLTAGPGVDITKLDEVQTDA